MEFLERYKFDFEKDLLGKGGFGEVYSAYDTLLNRDVALKFYRGSGSNKYDLISEIKKVIKLRHPNLLEFYDATILSHQNAFGQDEDIQVGVMELANEGDLLDFMQTNPTKQEIKIVFLAILSGLKFMHKNGFIHRDLKPQNILFVKKGKRIRPKIADFGISKNAISDNTVHSTKLIGTIEYMAPEQFNPEFAINGTATYNLDLWALGVMLYEILRGDPAFGKRSKTVHTEDLMSSICNDAVPKNIDSIEEPFKSVLQKCLVKDANKRVKSAEELIELMTSYNEKTVDKKVESVAKPIKGKQVNEVKKSLNPILKIALPILLIVALAIAGYFIYPAISDNPKTDTNITTIPEIEQEIDEPVIEEDILVDSVQEETILDSISANDTISNLISPDDEFIEEIIEEETPSTEKMTVDEILIEYNNCDDAVATNPCSDFTTRAICMYFGIDDLKVNDAYVPNQEIFNFVNNDNSWVSIGMASSQSVLDEAQQYANTGFPVIAINISDVNKLTTLVIKGDPAYSSTWGLKAPAAAALYPYKTRNPTIGKTLNWVWKSPDDIQIWLKK